MTHRKVTGRLTALYRYPVKGLTAEALDGATVEPGKTLAFDRAYAIENGPGRFDPRAPRHLPKINFIMLMRNEQLANLRSTFDAATQTLVLSTRDGLELARGDLGTAQGRAAIEAAIDASVTANKRGAPKIVASEGHSFSDVATKCLHLINLESLRSLQAKMGATIDPMRFRANAIIDRLPAWTEFDLIDRTLTIGTAELEIFRLTERCAATNVDPETGARDLKIPSFLSRTFGHTDFGVHARVVTAGTIRVGDEVEA